MKNHDYEITRQERGRITNIDYQTNWIYKELQKTNKLIESQNILIENQNILTHYAIRLMEHTLHCIDNPKLKEKVEMEMSRGLRLRR